MKKNYTVLTNAYNNCGDYIGSPDEAEKLFKRGINPELIDDSYQVCSIGFCKDEEKWYGWSHRAIYGFGIGSKVKKGDTNYRAPDRESFLNQCKDFWSNVQKDASVNITAKEGISETILEAASDEKNKLKFEVGVWVHDEYSEEKPTKESNQESRDKILSIFTPYPETWGRGEWQAKTLDDAKLMAIDFANNIS